MNDKYAYLKSPIHQWNQTPKLIGLLTLIFSFAVIQKLTLLIPMIGVTLFFFLLSKLPFSFLLNRLKYPGLFILAVVILLPFISGKTVIFSIGFLSIKEEGIKTVLLIVIRFICILTITIVLFNTATFLTTLKSLQRLGLSSILIDMMLLTYRYLDEIKDRLITMKRALQLRGFQPKNISKRNLQIVASLLGTLLVRSYNQSQIVYEAMILRGYGCKLARNKYQEKINFSHWLGCFFTIYISLILVVLEIK